LSQHQFWCGLGILSLKDHYMSFRFSLIAKLVNNPPAMQETLVWFMKLEDMWKWKSLGCVRFFVTPWTIQSMEFSRSEYWSGQPFHSPGDLPNPEIKPRSPVLWVDSLPAEPQGKPKNTGVGSLFLLQLIFLVHESNQGLLHCRWIIYQLSYQGKSKRHIVVL